MIAQHIILPKFTNKQSMIHDIFQSFFHDAFLLLSNKDLQQRFAFIQLDGNYYYGIN